MRVPDGAVRRTRNGGYLHRLHWSDSRPSRWRLVTLHPPSPTRLDFADLARRYQAHVNPTRLERLADALGLSIGGLRRLRIGWATADDLHETGTKCRSVGSWTFPMMSPAGEVQGIRLRAPDGFKYAVNGSRDGLFIPGFAASIKKGPASVETQYPLLVAEGPTDTAALLDLGFTAVGRSSCIGGVQLLVELVRGRRPDDVVIVADADEPGQRGAAALATILPAYVRVRIIMPPPGIKDARGWKQAGATAADVQTTIDSAPAWGAYRG